MNDKFDPITFEVIRNALDSIADEMALVITRTAYSPIVRDTMDYSTSFCDHNGDVASQGLTTALHLGSFPDAMAVLVERFKGDINEGDVFILNDPYGSGGMHLPDIYVIKPIFHDGCLEGYATTLVHHTDIGGLTPGGTAVHATEIFQEGLQIPLLKIYDRGIENKTLMEIILKNVRVPGKVHGDLRAQLAACRIAEASFATLIKRHGQRVVRRYIAEMHRQSELQMRRMISDLPDGTYTFEDYIDGFGVQPVEIKFCVAVTIKGDSAYVDWTGTSPQVNGAINAPGPFVRSATYIVFRSLVNSRIPNSVGYMRPITVFAPEGSILNPRFPAACNARGIVGFRAVDTLFGALSKAAPDRVYAAGEGGGTNPSIGGMHHGEMFIVTEGIMGSWGGRPGLDGLDGAANLSANQSNQPVEMLESDSPVDILEYSLANNSGGPGKHRGGMAVRRSYRLRAPQAVFTLRSDHRAHLPYGLAGGLPGTPSYTWVVSGGNTTLLPVLPQQKSDLVAGDEVIHIAAGGGGHGDPLERPAELVLEDVIDEKSTRQYAAEVYGVVIPEAQLSIDRQATERRRSEMRSSRQDGGQDAYLRHFKAANCR